MAQFALLGAAWKVAEGTKKCVDFLQSFQGIHEEGYILWQTIESMQEPLQLAVALRCRERAFRTLQHPLMLCNFLLQIVEKLIERDEEEEGRPHNRDSWTQWIIHKKDGRQRKDRIAEILPRLTHVMCTLNLALTTIQCRTDVNKISPGLAFYFEPSAFRSAQHLLQEFEFGRVTTVLLCHGILWTMVRHSSGSTMMVEKGMSAVYARKRDDAIVITFECIDVEEDDEPWGTQTVTLHADSAIRCTWKSKVPDLDSEREGIAICIDSLWLEYYPADEGVSSEAFVAILTLLCLPDVERESDSPRCMENHWKRVHW